MRSLHLVLLLIGCMSLTAARQCAAADKPDGLLGQWESPSTTGKAAMSYFQFDEKAVSFGGGPVSRLPHADDIPYKLGTADGKPYVELDRRSLPTGVGARMYYKRDGDRLVLTVEINGKAKDFELVRAEPQK